MNNNQPLNYINEMEMVDGKIWANIYYSDVIVVLNI